MNDSSTLYEVNMGGGSYDTSFIRSVFVKTTGAISAVANYGDDTNMIIFS